MKRKYIIILAIIIFVLGIVSFSNKSYAADLDRIENYVVTVDPRMNDGSLDIKYEITWKVLDSTTEGPLTWVKIGTPNENFDTPTALTNNIRKISSYNGSYVRIDFDRAYKAGERVTFKYSIHQSYMYKISWGNCKYKFTPAWFSDINVDNLTIKWNKSDIQSADNKSTEGNYFVWNKTYMDKGDKLTANIKYKKTAFSGLDSSKQRSLFQSSSGSSGASFFPIILFIIIMAFIFASFGGGGGYYGHSGFYGGYGPRYYGGGCVRSSCACACAHSSCASSCACACAGSGRAGCLRKDFYGTNLNSKKIKKAFK